MRALLCEPMRDPVVINTDDSLFAFQRLLGSHVDIADDFLDSIAVVYNELDYQPSLGNVFFFCDARGRLRHTAYGKILVIGVKDEEPCSLTDEQIKQYSRIFRSTVLYFHMQGEDNPDKQHHLPHKNKAGGCPQ